MRKMTPAEMKRAREELGLTQEQLANHLDVDDRTVRRWEGEERAIPRPVAKLVRLLAARTVSMKAVKEA